MKNICIIFIFTIVLVSCKNDKKNDLVEILDCSSVKTGTFKYANEAYGEWIIERNDSSSIERSPKTGMTIYSSVEWLSDCEYQLNVEDLDNADNMAVIMTNLRVVITDVMDYGYKCISYTNNGPEYFEMIRIE